MNIGRISTICQEAKRCDNCPVIDQGIEAIAVLGLDEPWRIETDLLDQIPLFQDRSLERQPVIDELRYARIAREATRTVVANTCAYTKPDGYPRHNSKVLNPEGIMLTELELDE